MFLFPRNDSDISGIFHKYRSISFEVKASSNMTNSITSIENNPEDVFKPGELEWGSKLGDTSPWISVHFFKNSVSISHYSVTSPKTWTHVFFPRCWDVYGEINNEWKKIASVQESGLNGNGITRSFPIYNNNFFTGFKFAMTCFNYAGEEHGNLQRNYFILNQIDLFGVVFHKHVSFKMTLKQYFPLFCILIQ